MELLTWKQLHRCKTVKELEKILNDNNIKGSPGSSNCPLAVATNSVVFYEHYYYESVLYLLTRIETKFIENFANRLYPNFEVKQ